MSGPIAVVVLAGGQGNRIGGHKPQRMLAGERLIDRAVRQSRRWSDLVAVSVGNPAQVGSVDAPLVADEPGVDGPLGGLISAFKFGGRGGREFVLTTPADMPFLPFDLLDCLSGGIGGALCALPSSAGHLHPDCGLWRTAALSQVDGYLATPRRSLIGFAEFVGFAEVEWVTDPFDPFFNINTADDLSRAERLV